MKNLVLIITIAFFAMSVQAQNIDLVTSKQNFEWVENNTTDLNVLVETMNTSFEDGNFALASRTKGDLMKMIFAAVHATTNLSNLAKSKLDGSYAARTGSVEVEAGSRSDSPYFTTLMVSEKEAGDLSSTVDSMNEIKKALEVNGFHMHPDQENTQENLDLLRKFSSLLNKTAELYKLAASRT